MAIGVLYSTQIDEGRDARDSDGCVDEAFTPGAAEGVRNDNAAPESPRKLACGAVRVFWQKRYGVDFFNIGLVHAGVGADKAVMSFADQHLASHPYDSLRFAENDFHESCIFRHSLRNRFAVWGGLHHRQ